MDCLTPYYNQIKNIIIDVIITVESLGFVTVEAIDIYVY